jgi:predicted DNA-binding protein
VSKKAERGRKPLDEQGPAKIVPIRIPPKLFNSLNDLAEKHGRNISKEIRKAVERWIERHEIPQLHTSALATAVAVLADRIERITRKKWTDDPLTRQLVRERAERLISHIVSPLSEPVTIPVEVKEDVDLILKLLIGAMPRPGSPTFGAVGIIIDDRGFASILQDLARDLGEGDVNIRALPALTTQRKQQKGKK